MEHEDVGSGEGGPGQVAGGGQVLVDPPEQSQLLLPVCWLNTAGEVERPLSDQGSLQGPGPQQRLLGAWVNILPRNPIFTQFGFCKSLFDLL